MFRVYVPSGASVVGTALISSLVTCGKELYFSGGGGEGGNFYLLQNAVPAKKKECKTGTSEYIRDRRRTWRKKVHVLRYRKEGHSLWRKT